VALSLAVAEQGEGPPVLILHGLFGSARNWATIAKRLAERYRVLAVDLRNHGDSPHAPSMSYDEMAEDVLSLIRERGLGPPAIVGHSMGGKVAMVAALLRPDSVSRLAVVDVAPVAYRGTLRAYADAMLGLDIAGPARRAAIDAALAESIPEPGIRAFLLHNLAPDGDGFRWRPNLPAIAAAIEGISSFPDIEGSYPGPALFIRGERSDYVVPGYEPRIRRLFARAQIVAIAQSGHWIHAEQPAAFLAALEPFLAANPAE
jgi:pimeloyl-ACP methyl ester carboxylesterase